MPNCPNQWDIPGFFGSKNVDYRPTILEHRTIIHAYRSKSWIITWNTRIIVSKLRLSFDKPDLSFDKPGFSTNLNKPGFSTDKLGLSVDKPELVVGKFGLLSRNYRTPRLNTGNLGSSREKIQVYPCVLVNGTKTTFVTHRLDIKEFSDNGVHLGRLTTDTRNLPFTVSHLVLKNVLCILDKTGVITSLPKLAFHVRSYTKHGTHSPFVCCTAVKFFCSWKTKTGSEIIIEFYTAMKIHVYSKRTYW